MRVRKEELPNSKQVMRQRYVALADKYMEVVIVEGPL